MSEERHWVILPEMYNEMFRGGGDGPSVMLTNLGTIRHAFWLHCGLRNEVRDLVRSELPDDTVVQITKESVGIV